MVRKNNLETQELKKQLHIKQDKRITAEFWMH
jgi:hypothetical protein